MIIQGDIANLPPDSTKYQVVVRAEDISVGLPTREILDLPLDERLEAKEFAL